MNNTLITTLAMKNKNINLKLIKSVTIFVVILVTIYYVTLETNEYVVYAEQANHVVSQNEVLDIKESNNELTPEKKEEDKKEWDPAEDVIFIVLFHCFLFSLGLALVVYAHS
jgi:hypothetical protein